MTVLECVKAAATELGITAEVEAYLQDNSSEGSVAVENLVRCFNLVENELATDYLPLFAEDTVETETGAVYYKDLERSPVRIMRVTDGTGEDIPFTLFPEFLKAQAGKLLIRYAYAPKEKTLDENSDYQLLVSLRLFAYGMAAEYALASGRYEDAAVWSKKYRNAVYAAYRKKPIRKIQSRRWV